MSCHWADYDRSVISQRYDRLAKFIPILDRMLFVPSDLRRKAVDSLDLKPGDSVVDVGCGTGMSFSYLRDAAGVAGQIYGIDISPGMLRKAHDICDANGWRNIELSESDAVDFVAPRPLDGALFSLTYNTIPNHRRVLRKVWDQLRPGGRLVIMDAKLPSGTIGKFILPFSLWLMKHTLLSNPLVRPWEEVAELAEHIDMSEFLFGAYYICRATKPLISRAAPSENRDLAGIEVID